MKLERKDNGTYRFTDDTGCVILLTANQMSFLYDQYTKITLRDSIEYAVDELVRDGELDLDKYPDGGREDFIDEVYAELENDIDCGEMPDDEDIECKIRDEATFYDMLIED